MTYDLKFSEWKTKLNYPDWAPPILLQSLWANGSRLEENVDILSMVTFKLCTDFHMESVWRKIRHKFPNDELRFNEFARELCMGIYESLICKTGWDSLTAAESKKKQGKIVSLLRELAGELKSYPVGDCIFDCFNESELNNTGNEFLFYLHIQGFLSVDLINAFKNKQTMITPYALYLGAANAAPKLDVLLSRMAEELSNQVIDPVLKSPNKENSDLRFLLRRLADFLTRNFNSPHYEILADIGMVFFPKIELDIQKVRFIVEKR